MKKRFLVGAFGMALFALACSEAPTVPDARFVKVGPGNTVTYLGQGLFQDNDGSWFLNTEICGVANGADVEGPYLL